MKYLNLVPVDCLYRIEIVNLWLFNFLISFHNFTLDFLFSEEIGVHQDGLSNLYIIVLSILQKNAYVGIDQFDKRFVELESTVKHLSNRLDKEELKVLTLSKQAQQTGIDVK